MEKINIREDETVFRLGGTLDALVFKDGDHSVLISSPVHGAIEGLAIQRFVVHNSMLYLEYLAGNELSSSVPASLELGIVEDNLELYSWLERVNKYYQNK